MHTVKKRLLPPLSMIRNIVYTIRVALINVRLELFILMSRLFLDGPAQTGICSNDAMIRIHVYVLR